MGSGKNISRASTHPLSTSPSSPSPRVGKITTHPGLRGRGEPGASVGKQMSPLAAPQPPGSAAPGGPPEDIHLPLLRQPAHNCLASAGVFFSDSAFRVCSFFTWELF